MLGVVVNVITVIVGSCIGLLFKKGIPEKVSKAAMIGLGACTLYIGISGSLCGENESLKYLVTFGKSCGSVKVVNDGEQLLNCVCHSVLVGCILFLS